jgi:hypothetical protein
MLQVNLGYTAKLFKKREEGQRQERERREEKSREEERRPSGREYLFIYFLFSLQWRIPSRKAKLYIV